MTGAEAGDVCGHRGEVVEVNAAQEVVVVVSQLEGQVVMTARGGQGKQMESSSFPPLQTVCVRKHRLKVRSWGWAGRK